MKGPFFYGHNRRLKQILIGQKDLVRLRIFPMIYDYPKLHSKVHLIMRDLKVHIDLMMQYLGLLDM